MKFFLITNDGEVVFLLLFFLFIFYQETQQEMMFQNHFDYSFPGQGNELLPPF